MANRFKTTILVHYVLVPSKFTGTREENPNIGLILRYVEEYREKFAFNIHGLIEKFIPSFERSGIEVFNLENEYE